MRPTAVCLRALPLLLAFALLASAHPEGEPVCTPAGERVAVPKSLLIYDDGDSILIRWPEGSEAVRILGMDTPETAHPEHDLPFAQPFGEAAAGFLRGCIAMTDKVEILRAADKDPYGRTLAYVFLDGRNYSCLVVEARLAVENVRHFGDNGFPEEAAAVLAAAGSAGPVAFEAPHRFRSRMRRVSAWRAKQGGYPDEDEAKGTEER